MSSALHFSISNLSFTASIAVRLQMSGALEVEEGWMVNGANYTTLLYKHLNKQVPTI